MASHLPLDADMASKLITIIELSLSIRSDEQAYTTLLHYALQQNCNPILVPTDSLVGYLWQNIQCSPGRNTQETSPEPRGVIDNTIPHRARQKPRVMHPVLEKPSEGG